MKINIYLSFFYINTLVNNLLTPILGAQNNNTTTHFNIRNNNRNLQQIIRLPGNIPNTNKQYLGAEIYTKQQVTYGRFEVAMRVTDISGVLSTFFWYKQGSEQNCNTYSTDCNGNRVKQCWQELDIEVMGRDKGLKTSTNIILREASNREMYEQLIDHSFANTHDNWGIYTMDWYPDKFVWTLNGQVIRSFDNCHVPSLFKDPMGMRLNSWSCQDSLASWCGQLNNNLPAVTAYDYVKYYSYDKNTKTFKLEWQDDFNTWNNDRWGIADWSFGENRVQFSPSNVFIYNGILFMSVDKRSNAGNIPQLVYDIANNKQPQSQITTTTQPTSCLMLDIEVDAGPDVGSANNILTADLCQKLCQQKADCYWFVWGSWKGCYLKGNKGSTYVGTDDNNVEFIPRPNKGFISGPKFCSTINTITTTSRPITTQKSINKYSQIPKSVTPGNPGTLRYNAFNKKLLIGAAIGDTDLNNLQYANLVKQQYNIMVAENACKPAAIDQKNCDRIYQFATDNGMTMRYHTLLWHTSMDPNVSNMNPNQKRNWIRQTFAQKVSKYASKSVAFDVVNEVLADNQQYSGDRWTFRNSMWYPAVNDFFDIAFIEAKKALPINSSTKLCYNDYSVESMLGWSAQKSNGMYNLVKDARVRGIPIDCVGFQFHIPYTWNMFDGFEQNIKRYNELGVEVHITELDVSCGHYNNSGWNKCTSWDNNKAQQQADVYRRILEICMKYPNCRAFVMWGVYDGRTWIANDYPLLFDKNFKPKPAFQAIIKQLNL